jgi:succinate dehydrogenase hydrophobic anchor subunit
MAGKIFINYRRGDDPGFAQALFGRLEQTFLPDQLFMDVANIEPGADFVRVLEEQVAQCDVFIAIIGKGWIDARDETGARRLDNPGDFVSVEIQTALKQDKRVIPVLVGQAQMPRAEELPEAMKPLARRNAVRLTHERFKSDVESLISAVQRVLKDVEDATDKKKRELANRSLEFEQEVSETILKPAGDEMPGAAMTAERGRESISSERDPGLDLGSGRVFLTHRITGVVLYCATPLFLWFVVALSLGPYEYSFIQKFLASFFGAALLFICVLALIFHVLAGLYSIWLTGFAPATSGSWYARHQQLTTLANLPLTIGFLAGVAPLWGRNHAAASQIVGSRYINLVFAFFIASIGYDVWLEMRRIIADHVANETTQRLMLIANTLYSIAVVGSCLYCLNVIMSSQ